MQLLRAQRAAEKLAITRSGFYKLLTRNKDFPQPYRISARHVAWSEEEIDSWLTNKQEKNHDTQ
mgnify:FL=1